MESKKFQMSNKKLIIWSIFNTLLTTLITSSINFYFSSKDLKDGKLIDLRQHNIKVIEPKLSEAKIILRKVSDLIQQINPADIISGKFVTREAHQKSYEVIVNMNRLVELSLELPYQMRHVLNQAHRHYYWLHHSKILPDMKIPIPELKNYSSHSFDIALSIAKENYILEGEPHHNDLSELITSK